MKLRFITLAMALVSSPILSRDLMETLSEQPAKVMQAVVHPDLRYCVITSIAARTGQASTVVERGGDLLVIVHNWSSPVPGDDVRAVFTVKQDGLIEVRGQRSDLSAEIERCLNL